MAPPREQLIERALTLIVQSEVAPGEAAANARLSLAQWQEKSPEHHAAMHEAHRRWCALGGMADDLRSHFQNPEPPAGASAATSKVRRRKLLLSIAGLLSAGGLLGKGVYWYWQQPLFASTYETQLAQTMRAVLPDGPGKANGSQVDLAPQSAISAALFRDRRRVRLARGEARFDVISDPVRPFEVLARQVRIEVIGTAFTVRDRGGAVSVGVERGQVRVYADGGQERQAAVLDLSPGQSVDILDGQPQAIRQVDPESLSAWRSGWLVFDNTPLSEALATINAYRRNPIVATSAAVESLRLTGRFRARNSAELITVLPTILPLSTHARPEGGVELRMR